MLQLNHYYYRIRNNPKKDFIRSSFLSFHSPISARARRVSDPYLAGLRALFVSPRPQLPSCSSLHILEKITLILDQEWNLLSRVPWLADSVESFKGC